MVDRRRHDGPMPGRSPRARGLAAGLAAAMAGGGAPAAADDPVPALGARAGAKNAAFMSGDMEGWARLVRIAPDFTLLQPFGGPASRGFDMGAGRLAELARSFRNGQTALEVDATYGSDGIVVLVMTERQRGEVGGLPRQDWSLRVTEVYRRDAQGWALVHRHADPLVHRLRLEQAAAIARGEAAGGIPPERAE